MPYAGKDIKGHIRELVQSYNDKGSGGKSKPKSAKKARKMATAIAHDKAPKK